MSALSSVRPASAVNARSTALRQSVDAPRVLPSQFRTASSSVVLAEKKRNVTVRASKKVNATASPVKSQGQKKISAEEAKELYRDMYLGREFEEMCAQMYYRGKMFGFVHLYSGQEAVSTGTWVD